MSFLSLLICQSAPYAYLLPPLLSIALPLSESRPTGFHSNQLSMQSFARVRPDSRFRSPAQSYYKSGTKRIPNFEHEQLSRNDEDIMNSKSRTSIPITRVVKTKDMAKLFTDMEMSVRNS